jgi:hypothetical protein
MSSSVSLQKRSLPTVTPIIVAQIEGIEVIRMRHDGNGGQTVLDEHSTLWLALEMVRMRQMILSMLFYAAIANSMDVWIPQDEKPRQALWIWIIFFFFVVVGFFVPFLLARRTKLRHDAAMFEELNDMEGGVSAVNNSTTEQFIPKTKIETRTNDVQAQEVAINRNMREMDYLRMFNMKSLEGRPPSNTIPVYMADSPFSVAKQR